MGRKPKYSKEVNIKICKDYEKFTIIGLSFIIKIDEFSIDINSY